MQSWTLAAALLCLASCVSLSEGQAQYTDVNSLARAGAVTFKGSKLRVFEIDGSQFAEPRIAFKEACSSVRFSRVYMKYQLVMPIRIDTDVLKPTTHSTKKVVKVKITGLKVKPDKGLARSESGHLVMTKLKRSRKSANLIFLCSTYLRCRYLRDEFKSRPSGIRDSLKFQAIGRVGDSLVSFGVKRSANRPSLKCDQHRWVVFQRRVDGSLSFAQNWDAYVQGFGNPRSNYWMGLDRLSEMTQTSSENGFAPTARCGLKIETEDFAGNKYSAEFRMFEVLGSVLRYRLRVGQQVGRSELGDRFLLHNEMYFSTIDVDNDRANGQSCAQRFGYGGWWYNACHWVSLNGAYTTDRSITNSPTYSCFYVHNKYLPMKKTLMKFKC